MLQLLAGNDTAASLLLRHLAPRVAMVLTPRAERGPRLISTSRTVGEAHMDVAQYIAQRPSQQQELFLPALKSARVGALAAALNLSPRVCDPSRSAIMLHKNPALILISPRDRRAKSHRVLPATCHARHWRRRRPLGCLVVGRALIPQRSGQGRQSHIRTTA